MQWTWKGANVGRWRSERCPAAQESERIGIARDLHDEVGLVLTDVLLERNVIADTAPGHRDAIDTAKHAVRGALDEVRRISNELRSEMLEHFGFVTALTELSRSVERGSAAEVERRFDPSLPALPDATELAVYRVTGRQVAS